MASNALLCIWDSPIPGREEMVGPLFREFMQYLGELQEEGEIDSFTPVLLDPYGGKLNGLILIQAESTKLDELTSSEEWLQYMTRGGTQLTGFGALRGATEELIAERMNRWIAMLAESEDL